MATKTWTGASSTDYATAGNWTPNGVPASGDALVFPAAPTRNCAGSGTAKTAASCSIAAAGSVNLTNVTITGATTIGAGAAVTAGTFSGGTTCGNNAALTDNVFTDLTAGNTVALDGVTLSGNTTLGTGCTEVDCTVGGTLRTRSTLIHSNFSGATIHVQGAAKITGGNYSGATIHWRSSESQFDNSGDDLTIQGATVYVWTTCYLDLSAANDYTADSGFEMIPRLLSARGQVKVEALAFVNVRAAIPRNLVRFPQVGLP